MAEESLLRISNLTKIYRKSHLGRVHETTGVKDLSLEIFHGEIFGLLGLNGAGKTTTLKLILGLLFPTEGEVRLFGKKLPDSSAIRQVGFLPETPYFPKHFTVKEMLEFYGLLSGVPEKEIANKAQDVLKTVNMFQNQGKRIKECSKGMLQRLSLAQALIHDPRLLVLDEPITGLDPLGLAEMREMILRLNREGKTILFSSHIISEVEKIAGRVGILSGGKLIRVIPSQDWRDKTGALENMFVETVKSAGGVEI